MPSAVLGNEPKAPSRPMRTSSEEEEISTPQIIRVTVTCLVCAMGSHATVRSCVTWAAIPVLSDGDKTPQDGRESSARGGTDPSVPPLRQFPAAHSQIQGWAPNRAKIDTAVPSRRTLRARSLGCAAALLIYLPKPSLVRAMCLEQDCRRLLKKDAPFGSEPPCMGGCGSQRATRPVNRPLVRVSGGMKYTITRTYKNNLRFLADIWLSTEI